MADPASRQEVRCAGCAAALSSFFEVNGTACCDDCKDKALAAQRAPHLGTLIRGGALGFVAAAIGAGIYYAIAEATGKEFGWMSIVLGLIVGFAVRIGSRGRGGWRYQALAMFLCYLAIASTYVPRVISAARMDATATAPGATALGAPPGSAATPAAVAQPAAATPAASEPPSPGSLAQALAMLFVLCLALPFLAGTDNLIGLIIIAIGLYEAWKVNAGVRFSLKGPFMAGEERAG